MKNLFKFGFLALALSLTVVACSSEEKSESADSLVIDTTVVIDSAIIDTVAVDTTAL